MFSQRVHTKVIEIIECIRFFGICHKTPCLPLKLLSNVLSNVETKSKGEQAVLWEVLNWRIID